MLELRPFCECCERALPPSSEEAMICTFECTFCAKCNDQLLRGACPNCGGNLVKRPVRPEKYLESHPPSTKRIVKERGCFEIASH